MTLSEIIRNVADLLDDAICILEGAPAQEKHRRVLWCNTAFAELFGYECEELVGETVACLYGPETNRETLARFLKVNDVNAPLRERMVCYHKDGTPIYLDIKIKPVNVDSGGEFYWITRPTLVSEHEKLHREVEEARNIAERAQQRLWSAINALPHAFVIYDKDDRLVVCNDKYRSLHAGAEEAMVPGALFKDILLDGLKKGEIPEAIGNEEAWLEARLEHHRNPKGPIETRLPNNRYLQIHEHHTDNGDVVGFRFDVTELHRQKQEVEAHASQLTKTMQEADIAARTDALTGLGNRRGLDVYMKSLQTRLSPRDRVAFLHIDLDRFKQINDMFGHAAGDHVLRRVSKVLLSLVSEEDFVGRVGGDEFVIVLSHQNVRSIADRIAEGIVKKCGVPVSFEGKPCRFGASVGVAISDRDGIGDLMVNADIALYEAKTLGRNRSTFFSKRLRDAAEEKKRLADELLEGLEKGAFVSYLQPLVDSQSRDCVGVEALARWEHPERGLVTPDVFLPIAEELGVLARLDQIIMNQTFDMVNTLNAEGAQIPKVSLNLSYRRLANPDFIASLQNLPPEGFKLSFELLETIDFDDQDGSVFWTIDAIRERGIEVQIDDFGSGHASMTSLLKIRPDRVKIDRTLVAAACAKGSDTVPFVKAIVDMARAMGIGLTAEGIETEAQARLVGGLGCDVLQGYLISKPLKQASFLKWSQDWRKQQKARREIRA